MITDNLATDIAVIFKTQQINGVIEFIPVEVVLGCYNTEDEMFYDINGTSYAHIINGESYGYAFTMTIEDAKKNYSNLSLSILKRKICESMKKSQYFLSRYEEEIPIIMRINNKKKKGYSSKPEIIADDYLLILYLTRFPSFAGEVFHLKEEEKKDEKIGIIQSTSSIDISKLYTELTSHVVDQDAAIRTICTAIWKQYNNFYDGKSRNILMNGQSGVGKTEISRILTANLNVPYYVANATEYTAAGYVGKDVESMIRGLIINAGGDIKKAERGILFIDEFDKLADDSRTSSVNKRDVQEGLLKIIEDGTYNITINDENYTFNTGNLLVVGMGSYSKIEVGEKTSIGFEKKKEGKKYQDLTREDFIANGMIPELIGRFPVIVQMNDLTFDSYIKILNLKYNALSRNKDFLKGRNVDLTLEGPVLESIAAKAAKEPFGARSLDEIIEKSLAEATFEIATHPEEYSELIITPETISDNKNYKLVRRLCPK